MTDRIDHLTVILERDIRDDDLADLVTAIEMLRGVLSVHGHVADPLSFVAQQRAKQKLREKLLELLKDDDF